MNPEDLAQTLVHRWISWYVRGLPDELAQRRFDEIRADVHDQIADELARGHAGWLVAGHVAWRTVKGMPADLLWRAEVRGRSRPRHHLRQMGAMTMAMFGRLGAIIGATAAVLVTSWLFVSVLIGRGRPLLQSDAFIVAWLAFGAALAGAVRWMPRRVAAGAAFAVGGIGVADLLLAPFGHDVGWLAASEYLWIALAALAFKALTPESAADRATPSESTSAHSSSTTP